jgi:hypothetical protein
MRLKERLRNASAEAREAKTLAAQAIAVTKKIRMRSDAAKISLQAKIDELETALAARRESEARLEERHHAALRLIGELWTRNQALVERVGLSPE